jgi:hypothetical protein
MGIIRLQWCYNKTQHTNTYITQNNIPRSKKKLHGLSPRANYTDRATAACRRSDCEICG